MTYEPKGCMLVWLAAMQDEPDRIWTSAEAAKVMGVRVGTSAATPPMPRPPE
jgi:hypothetical protein